MSYVLNFPAEILLILTFDIGYTDKAVNDSSFHIMGVVGLEMQMMYFLSIFIVNLIVGLEILS
jgi:hypothetical protein